MTDSLADRERRKIALEEMVRIEEEIRSYDPELYDANQHWINNPLIKPISKVDMFERWEERVRGETKQELVELLKKELTAVMEVGEEKAYCQGLEHGILLLENGKTESDD